MIVLTDLSAKSFICDPYVWARNYKDPYSWKHANKKMRNGCKILPVTECWVANTYCFQMDMEWSVFTVRVSIRHNLPFEWRSLYLRCVWKACIVKTIKNGNSKSIRTLGTCGFVIKAKNSYCTKWKLKIERWSAYT